MNQACVYESQIQYRKSNDILTNVVQRLYSDNVNVISQQLKEAIENYQVKITGKRHYFGMDKLHDKKMMDPHGFVVPHLVMSIPKRSDAKIVDAGLLSHNFCK